MDIQAKLNVVQQAKRNARYGHRDWIVWKDKAGDFRSARASAESIKQAMLDTGTQKHFTLYCANDGHGMMITWSIANIMRRNYLKGYQ